MVERDEIIYTAHLYTTRARMDRINQMIDRRTNSPHGKIRRGDVIAQILLAEADRDTDALHHRGNALED